MRKHPFTIHRLYMYQPKQNSVCVSSMDCTICSENLCLCVLRKNEEKYFVKNVWQKVYTYNKLLGCVCVCVCTNPYKVCRVCISTIYILCSDDALNIYRKLSIFICHNTMRYKIESFSWFSGCLMFTMILPDIGKKKGYIRIYP